MDRRKFLQVSGSLALGVAFAGVMGRGLWKMLTNPGELFYDAKSPKGTGDAAERTQFVSPYRRTFGFVAPDEIVALELLGDEIVVATPNNIYIYGLDGSLVDNFAVRSDVRDIAAYDGRLYVLFPERIEVYSPDSPTPGPSRQGEGSNYPAATTADKHTTPLPPAGGAGGGAVGAVGAVEAVEALVIKACSDDADYCQLTVFDGGIFVTDASAKNICQYGLDGTLKRFIKSPRGFVVPSYSFGITNMDGHVYCSNPGRHVVEEYTADGDYVGSFGRSGSAPGEFSGCCNPVQVTTTSAGELLTSEKGLPRISCYAKDGTFRSILLDDRALGGGHAAYDVRVMGDKLIVAGGNKISVFQYDKRRSAQTLCGACTVDCPMKV